MKEGKNMIEKKIGSSMALMFLVLMDETLCVEMICNFKNWTRASGGQLM